MGFFDSLNSVSTTVEKGVTEASGRLNKQKFNERYNLEPQWSNLFEIIVYKPSIRGIAGAALSAITPGAVSNLVSGGEQILNLNALSVSCNTTGFIYEWAGEVQYVKDLAKPDTITFQLIEDIYGGVRQFLVDWMIEIAEPEKTGGGFTDASGHIEYTFNGNQNDTKRNCKILLLDRKGLPGDIILKVDGLRPKTISEVTVDHASGDPIIFNIECAIDNAMWESLTKGIMSKGRNIAGAVKSGKSIVSAFS